MENKSNAMKITVKGVIDIIFRNKKIIVITFTICVLLAMLGIQFITPVYEANVKMLVRGQAVVASELYESINARGIQATQAEIVKSEPVLKRSAIALGLQNRPFDYEKNFSSPLKRYYIEYNAEKNEKRLNGLPADKIEEIKLNIAIESLRGRLTVQVLPMTDIFFINVKAFTPEEAIETANVISRSYTMFDQIQQLAEVRIRYGEFHPTVIQLIDSITQATNNLSGKPLSDIEAIGTASVKIIQQATSDYSPVSKPIIIIMAIALLASLCFSLGLAFIKGFFDSTIKTPQDIADFLDIPCVGSIPEKQRKDRYLITDDSPDTEYYKYYEELSEQLLVFLKTQGMKTALITSPVFNNNHRYIVPNLGYFLSRVLHHRILLVDVNFNAPHFQKIYSLKDDNGIDRNTDPAMCQNILHKMERGPDIITARVAPEKPSNILEDLNFKDLIESIKDQYDAILIDATSINSMKDVSFISEYSEGIVLVIDEGKLQREMLKNTLPRLRHDDAVIIGGILNNRTFPIPEFIYKNFKYFID